MNYPVFSGDMAALNQGFAAQEDAAIRRRAANQAFLSGLTGQMQQANMARQDQANRLQIAQMQDATNRDRIQQEGSLGRQREANNMLKVINDQNQALALLENERNKLRVLESQGNASAALEGRKLDEEMKYRTNQLANIVEVARINSAVPKFPASTQVEVLRQGQEADDFNRSAAAAASALQDKVKPGNFVGYGSVTPEEVAKAMTADERMLVTFDPKTGKFVPNRKTAPTLGGVGQPGPGGLGAALLNLAGRYLQPQQGSPTNTGGITRRRKLGEVYPEVYTQ